MDLAREVTKYIKHKIHLADHSPFYMDPGALVALQFCYGLVQLFCRQKQYLTKQDIARFVIQNKNHLFNILPSPNNKSYTSSLEKYNSIIAESELTLKPKSN
jgi:hypothetical protein